MRAFPPRLSGVQGALPSKLGFSEGRLLHPPGGRGGISAGEGWGPGLQEHRARPCSEAAHSPGVDTTSAFPGLPWRLEGQVRLGLFPRSLRAGETSSYGPCPSPSLWGSPRTPRPVGICLCSSASRQTTARPPRPGQGQVQDIVLLPSPQRLVAGPTETSPLPERVTLRSPGARFWHWRSSLSFLGPKRSSFLGSDGDN